MPKPYYVGLGGNTSHSYLALYLNAPCNIKCKKCGQVPPTDKQEITPEERNDLLAQFKGLGGKSVIIFGHNEPLLTLNWKIQSMLLIIMICIQ